MRLRILVAVMSALLGMGSPAGADYRVREVGSFHIGGRDVVLSGLPIQELSFTAGMAPIKVDPNGEFIAGQMYVQYVRLAEPRRLPILFWHGGGLSGVTWETKPDGKPGWQQFFLAAGYDTYVSDAVERGRASWARYPEIYPSAPFFRPKKEAWELFRIGPTYEVGGRREAFSDTQFPIEAFDQFARQQVPRWASNDAATQAAYDALIQKVCPCIVIVHSQGGNFGFRAALNAPDKVRALVAIEPSGAPDPATVDLARIRGVPHLVVFGDHLEDSPPWQTFVRAPRRYATALAAAGGAATWLDLPAEGIRGNSHMVMMDRNSDAIAQRVQDWLIRTVPDLR
ncbi:esterase [Phreatobacter sp. AB_2022a]|uniref:esterase n=1 Tax=Phreatobacter sp. AB_2022a TaxID=3003134 RepID=UPI002286F679|nr:esterase [Phreatobacter sp. AB_2022a]MCZ0737187.1 esterase [Phreatobacter sp. AB_2022a]